MAPSRTLTPDEVDAMLVGGNQTLRALSWPASPARAYVARYDRCSACGCQMPALLTFSGDTDWSPSIALDDPLRDAVRGLRASTGKRTILLCSPCVGELHDVRPATAAGGESPRLFEV